MSSDSIKERSISIPRYHTPLYFIKEVNMVTVTYSNSRARSASNVLWKVSRFLLVSNKC